MRHRLVYWRNVCYHIFHWFVFFVCQRYAVTLLELFAQLIVVLFTAECVVSFVVCLSFFWCSCLEAPLCTTLCMTIKRVFKRDLTCLTQLFNCFSLIIFYRVPPIFLSRRASDLVHPYRRSLFSLSVEKMCFATTFTPWEGSARKYGSGISVWSFPFDDLRTWPWAPLDGCLSTACIVLSLPLTMKSMIKKWL